MIIYIYLNFLCRHAASCEAVPSKKPSISLDPLDRLPSEYHDLIFQHFRCKPLLNLSCVSSSWAQKIGTSSVAMKKVYVNYNHDSKHVISESLRSYQNIKIKQDIMNQEESFLLKLLKFSSTMNSLSFEGFYEVERIEKFSECLRIKHQTPLINFPLKHLRFFGEVTNIDKILLYFSIMLGIVGRDAYESIELNALSSETFAKTFQYLQAKKLILNGMEVGNLSLSRFVYLTTIEHLQISLTTLDEESAELLRDHCIALKQFTIDDWNFLDEDAKNVFINLECHEAEQELVVEELIRHNEDWTAHTLTELHDYVFQHLSFEELMNSSTVSREWFEASSKMIEEKSVFDTKHSDIPTKNRKRRYQNIHATINEEINIMKILPFAENLTELYLEVMPESNDHIVTLFSKAPPAFNKLNLLELACHENSTLDNLKLPITLKTLHLTNFTLNAVTLHDTDFFNFLCKAKELSELKFFQSFGLENLFKSDVSEIFPFNLKTLKLPILKRVNEVKNNFDKFLLSQSKSLEDLSLHKVNVCTIQKLTIGFKLKSFGFMFVEGSSMEIKGQMTTITDLQLPQIKGRTHFASLKRYMSIAPDMKIVHVYRLNENILLHLQENFKKLEEIRYDMKWLGSLKTQLNNKCYNGIKLISGDIVYEEYAD